jgi:23S rRNA (uridine2552-2'-O)-methyltransferase
MAAPRKLHDRYFKQAKADGYLARSAYKLQEILERRHLIRVGDRVLDLGCAPGSWLQVASENVGPRGIVLGIDLQDIRTEIAPNVRTIRGDIFETDPAVFLELAGGPFDCVISDMAPNTSGHGDDFLSVRLCRRVLDILPGLLRPGGNLTMKVFEGSEFQHLVRETQQLFSEARSFKPKASRDVSRETYIIALGYRAPTQQRPLLRPPAGPPEPIPGWSTGTPRSPQPPSMGRPS